MNRYKIFLKTGETVEVEAESVQLILDESGHVYRHDFTVCDPTYITRPIAIFYTKEITGWAELPESEEISNEKAITNLNLIRVAFVKAETKEQIKLINDTIDKAIEALKPETGHWIMHQDHRECSECGVYLLKDMPRNSYCPNCGTRMTESEDKS